MRRLMALTSATVSAAALALQLGLMFHTPLAAGGIVQVVWRFLGYFTLLTNLGVTVVATALAIAPRSRLGGPRVRLAAVVSIGLVGLVYSVALRRLWNPTGWQAVADHALHDIAPLLFLAVWAAHDHGRLRWRDTLWGVAPALAYCVYALARGAADGWYAYWFLDPGATTAPELIRTVAGLSAAFLVASGLFVALDRRIGRARQ